MAESHLKSAAITNLNATPPLKQTAGEGASAELKVISDYVDPLDADDNASDYRLARFPTTARIKAVYLSSKVATAGNADIGVAHSTSETDGTPVDKQGDVIDADAFGAAQSLVLAGVRTDITFKNQAAFTPAEQNKPAWEAFGLASDPGGYFDLFLAVSTAITTGGRIGVEIYFS